MKGEEGAGVDDASRPLGCVGPRNVRGCERPRPNHGLTRDRAKIELSHSDEACDRGKRRGEAIEVFAPRNFDASERLEVRILDLDVEEEEARAA